MSRLEQYFSQFKQNIVGENATFESPFGNQKVIYTDWTASGRLYRPIEEAMLNKFGPYVANTHTETSFTGAVMTHAYHQAKHIIKAHVNANEGDALILDGTGMTGVINKFQRILGLRIPEIIKPFANALEAHRPVVFITHMEHHSNHTSWLETIADVVIIPYDNDGLVDYDSIEPLFEKYKDRSLKIASVTACSNVTGIRTDYHRIAEIAHKHNGLCFVDFACSAPYVSINMHPENKAQSLDAVFFSPHKFLGGPGTEGVLVFNKKLYKNVVPDNPGGGTVTYTSPWGKHDYVDDVEVREDGGTPGFLQTIRTAMAVQLKEQMGVKNILDREHEINAIVFEHLEKIPNLTLLAAQHKDRMGVFSFYIDDAHFNLVVKLLSDRFGIQTRGGCSCAGTYGHFLLHIDSQTSNELKEEVLHGDLLKKPGWVRMSIHPTTTDEEIKYVCESIKAVAENHPEWGKDYEYDCKSNEYHHKIYVDTSEMLANKLLMSGLKKS
ncbi:MAG: selenocysteine lyase [Flavobacteriia bacterium]|nr:MAG: selenocysteine lyase [Flavobacteriia bacterium]